MTFVSTRDECAEGERIAHVWPNVVRVQLPSRA
jgi:hypothetical protein